MSERGLQRENIWGQQTLSTKMPVLARPWAFFLHPSVSTAMYGFPSSSLCISLPYQGLQIEGNVDNFPVFQLGNSPKTNPDIKARPKKSSCVRQKTPTSGGFNAPTVRAVHFLCPELLCLPALVSQVSIPCCQLIITEAAGSRVGTS